MLFMSKVLKVHTGSSIQSKVTPVEGVESSSINSIVTYVTYVDRVESGVCRSKKFVKLCRRG